MAGIVQDDYSELPASQAVYDVHLERAAIEAGLRFRPRFNVWGIGKIMHDAMTLSHGEDLDAEMDRHDESYWVDHRMRAVAEFGRETYSPELCRLTRDCLDICQDTRPRPAALLRRVQAGRAQEMGRLRAREEDGAGDSRSAVTKLYFDGNEINQMRTGDFRRGYRRGDWDALVANEHFDWQWTPLRPPTAFHLRATQEEKASRVGQDSPTVMLHVPPGPRRSRTYWVTFEGRIYPRSEGGSETSSHDTSVLPLDGSEGQDDGEASRSRRRPSRSHEEGSRGQGPGSRRRRRRRPHRRRPSDEEGSDGGRGASRPPKVSSCGRGGRPSPPRPPPRPPPTWAEYWDQMTVAGMQEELRFRQAGQARYVKAERGRRRG